MASMVGDQNWDHMNGHDGSENLELSPRNHNLLMSLLDETQVDDCDDERLRNVIRSLEAEIDSTSHYALDDIPWESDLEDCQSSIDESYCQNPRMVRDDIDLDWMDIEIVPTSPSGNMGSWYMDQSVNEFGWLQNYSCVEGEQEYGSLWHETSAAVID